MQQLKKVSSCVLSSTFGQTVNGRVNRVAVITWTANSSDFVFVGQDVVFQGNMSIPEKFGNDIAAFASALQKAVDNGEVKVYGYEFPVADVSNGACVAYKNAAHADRTPMEVIRRAWYVDNDPSLLGLVRRQVEKSVKAGKLIPVTAPV